MRKLVTLLCLGAALSTASPVLAGETAACGKTPRDQWLPEATVKTKVIELGYDVRSIKAEKGCYEVRGTDKSGAKVNLYVDPATGEVTQHAKKNKS